MTRYPVARTIKSALAVSAITAASGAVAVYAQVPTSTSSGQNLQEVVVTGSMIKRTDIETPSPVQVISSEQLLQSGYTNTQEVLKNLTANGQGTLSQSFSGAFASGAAGIALRGLNVGYTLVLIDGHRMAPYPIGDDGQRSFVDVSNIPFDAIERIEVLKDGASAIYGSDAIAGVINIILKKTVQGASLSGDLGTASHGAGSTYHADATWGIGDLVSDGHNFYISGEFRKQKQILFADRGNQYTQTDFTSTGGLNLTLGVPNTLNGGIARSGTGYVQDPASGNIVGFMPGCSASSYTAGQCTYADTWDQIQPPTSNYNFVTRYTQSLTRDWQLSLGGTFFDSKSEQANRPQHTFAGGYQGVTSGPGVTPTVVPAIGPTTISPTNPSFPAGVVIPGGAGILRYTFLNLGPEITQTDAKSYRTTVDLDGKIFGSWDLNLAAGYSEVKLDLTGLNYVNPGNLQKALDSTTAPFLVGQPNTPAVDAFVAPVLTTTDTSKLGYAHAGVSRGFAVLPGGPLGVAVGVDYYNRRQYGVAPADVANGLLPDFSNNFTVGTQNVASAYAELVAPIMKQLELEAAVRYDHYNLSGGQASPKAGFKWTPISEFALRGTASKGFRAPGPAENGQSGQTFFAGTTNDPILCPNPAQINAPGNFVDQCVVSVPGLQTTNPTLKSETSKSFTLGVIVQPIRDVSSTLDLYSIDIDNQIVSGGPSTIVRGNNLTPIPQYQSGGGTALVAPPAAPILYQSTSFINANKTKTDGLDLSLSYRHLWVGVGEFRSEALWSYTNKYEMTINGVTYQLAGTHGPSFFSGDTGNPKSRLEWANSFGRGPWSATITMNYVSAFNVTDPTLIAFLGTPADTCLTSLTNQGGTAGLAYAIPLSNGVIPNPKFCTVDHFTTFDLYTRWQVNRNFNVHGSVTNLFGAKAPLDWVTYGGALGAVPWNPSLHLQGAIGTFYNVGASYSF